MNISSITLLNGYLKNFDDISLKKSNQLTFHDVISLTFHGAKNLSELEPDLWEDLYKEFIEELYKQNKKGWPLTVLNYNIKSCRIDVNSTKPYIKTKNFLMQLFRLLYLETVKEEGIQKTFNFHQILSYQIIQDDELIEIENISLKRLFVFLSTYLKYYISIYNDETKIEYQLGKVILNQI
uniref:Uncharacterized protein n=1 Tax=viral metagenome TaxID=1070528 RepID=A0A6C0LUS9_9ZZZZ